MDLIPARDLAADLGVTEAKLAKWRLRYHWPAVKIGRTVLFTPEQVDQILADHTDLHEPDDEPTITGQTSRSAARSRA